jgi:predicted hydrocarbon binding protein
VRNALDYAAQYLAKSHSPVPMPLALQSVQKYYPNKFGLIMVSALEKMADRPSFERVLSASGMGDYVSPQFRSKINNLEKGFDFAYISSFCAALEEVYGMSTGMDMARKIGEEGFLVGLQDFGLLKGLSKIYYSFLPYRTKLLQSLNATAKVLNQLSDQKCAVTETEHEFLFSIHECPYCVGRTSSSSICHMFGGLLSELVLWVTREENVIIEERKCKAKGDRVCEFSIMRKLGI